MSSKIVEFSKPFEDMKHWLKDAEKSEPNDPTAVALASVNQAGSPSIRMVLMRGFDEKGAVFYTNFESRKGEELLATPNAAMLFHWKTLRRQIRLEGDVEEVSAEEADAYFAARPRASQIGAWASAQSRPMEGRFEFEAAIAKYTAKFGVGPVPRPPHWSGFRLKPSYFEFWNDKKFRLHERISYSLNETNTWDVTELYP